jgi:hypothetical protein
MIAYISGEDGGRAARMLHADHPLRAHGDGFWRMARPALAAGAVELDRHLADAQPDGERGLTLILRPPAAIVTGRIALLRYDNVAVLGAPVLQSSRMLV